MPAPDLMLLIEPTDPQGPEALGLLRLAAAEARALYPELHAAQAPVPMPGNAPTPPRGTYLLARVGGQPTGMGAHRPLDAATPGLWPPEAATSELRRIYVHPANRRQGVAAALLVALEAHARSQGFARLVLETGDRQAPALALYAAAGYQRIAPFGAHADDPTSVCLAKRLV